MIGPNALAWVLAALTMLAPFCVDAYLPAFASIATSLAASPIEVQHTLTLYMLSFAAMLLWHGALSDAYGRRNIVLVSLSVFVLATLGCALAQNIEQLWAFRVLQGLSAGAGVVVGKAIIRDVYSDAQAVRVMSLVTMIFSIAPALAPIIGGWIVTWSDWRAVFLFVLVYALVLLAYCQMRLPETLLRSKRQPFTPRFLLLSYVAIFRSPLFQFKTGALAFNFAGLFLYVAASPVFITRHLGLGVDQFAWQFVPAVAGMFLGSLAANRVAGKIEVQRQIALGYACMLGAALFNVGYHLFFPPALPWSVTPLFFYTFGMAAVAPAGTLLVMDLFPNNRGLMASCQTFTLTMLATVVGAVIAPALSGSVLWLALGQLGMALVGLLLWMGARRYRRRHPMPAGAAGLA